MLINPLSTNAIDKHGIGARSTNKKLVDIIFSVIIFITSTQSYRYISEALGFSDLSIAIGGITISCLLYILYNLGSLKESTYNVKFLFFAIIIAPIVWSIIAPYFSIKILLLQLHYYFLMLAVMVYFRTAKNVVYLFPAALIFSFIFMVYGLLRPDFFMNMALMASAKYDYFGRGSGFFLQPNLLAYNLLAIYFISIIVLKKNSVNLFSIVSVFFLISMVISGSRGGMVAGAIAVFGSILADKRLVSKRFLKTLSLCAFVIYGLSVTFISDIDIDFDFERVSSFFQANISDDASVSARLEYQQNFLDMILANPIFGYGFGSVAILQDQNQLMGASHNQFLHLILEFGVVGFLIFLYGAYLFYRKLINLGSVRGRLWPLFVLLSYFAAMSGTNMILSMQNTYIFIALIFTLHRFEKGGV